MTSETGFDVRKYDRFPTEEPRPEGELEQLEAAWCGPRRPGEWITAINNNIIGVYYVGAAMLFFVLAGVLALLMRTQLALPMNGFLAQETYNQIFTMHGTVMMFLFAVPAVEALGVLLLPQMLGARDLPFPRLGAYAFWAYLIGGLAFFCSLFFGLAPDGGWFMYPPLTGMTYSPGINADFWLLGIGFIEISAIAGAIEIIVGVLKTRAPGMTLDKLPVFAWAMLIFACMIIIAFPSVILATLLLELERALGWPFFDPLKGGDPMLWQHLFWFFGHPEVYIIFLPAAGAMSTIIPAMARTQLVGHPLVVMAMLATGFISFGVWAHHMFTTGMPQISINYFSAASMAVSVPAGVQVFAWIATIAAGRMRLTAPGLFAVGGLVIFVMGGLSGVMVAMVPFDWQAHDSYFIVAHLHYVLIGGMVFPMFAAIYYWLPMSSARPLSERVGRWVFWLMFAGHNIAFLPMHLTGLMGMPRRVYTYLPSRGWDLPNLISTVGAFLFGLAVLLWVVDMIRNFRPFGPREAGNIHGGPGLEWLPSGYYSVRSVPVVKSLYPLWEQKGLAKSVEEGHWILPGAPGGERQTLVTSPLNAEPQYVLRLPRPSPWHVFGAVFTAGFFLILTIQAYAAAVVSGILAVYCIMRWCWFLDAPQERKTTDIGAGIRMPNYVSGPSSHGWWAMVIVLIVGGMVCLLAGFSYVFLWSRRPDLWQASPGTMSMLANLSLLTVAGLCATAAPRALRRVRRGAETLSPVLLILGAAGALAALSLEVRAWSNIGLKPDATSQGASVFALLGWAGTFAGIGTLMGGYILLRRMFGRLAAERPSTVDLIGLFLAYTAAQGAAVIILIRLFPEGGA
ncbi:cbb3-type cytochrome c oxidase subunit I [Brevundimonas faecalis]|uniref:Cytochrome c oxidase subunit I+III n=1 Tax=Brevundimonas faecalis TaxID=947378 RepID=A0ABV2R7Z3_9CAUL